MLACGTSRSLEFLYHTSTGALREVSFFSGDADAGEVKVYVGDLQLSYFTGSEAVAVGKANDRFVSGVGDGFKKVSRLVLG